MISRKILAGLFMRQPNINIKNDHRRNIQVSIIGSSGEIGSHLALSIKNNYKVETLKLYDDEERVKGYATELNLLPGGPNVIGYTAGDIIPAVCDVDMIVITPRAQGPPERSKMFTLEAIAPTVQNVCFAMAAYNPNAFLALSLDPVNSLVPFAAAIFQRQKTFNPFKLMGVTQIDSTRCKSLVANVLKANPRQINIPVIGGHSEETIVPLFSNLTPTCYSLDEFQADMLNRLLKRADHEVFKLKQEKAPSTVAMSYSLNEFCKGIIDAIWFRTTVELHCFTANPHFGTRYFAGPNLVGPHGITQTPNNFKMNKTECDILSDAVQKINRDVKLGEDLYASIIQAPTPIDRQQIPKPTIHPPIASKITDKSELFKS